METSGVAVRPVMMLWSPELAVVPVTIHLPLREVIPTLTPELVAETGRIVARDSGSGSALRIRASPSLASTLMLASRALSATRIATLSAWPWSASKPRELDARGPLPADSLFHAAARANYDVALAMYHDQALIPIKTLAFDHAVNVTLGLPFVRTSPDHGTAFDIAGTGRANAGSLIAALQLAARLARNVEPQLVTRA